MSSTQGKLFSKRTDELFRIIGTPVHGPNYRNQVLNKMNIIHINRVATDLNKDLPFTLY